MYIVEHHAEG